MTTIREALLSPNDSNKEITIDSMNDDSFFFNADFEIPVQTCFFMEDPKCTAERMIRFKKFEVLEVEKVEGGFRYYAVFVKNKFNFEEWEKTHKKKTV